MSFSFFIYKPALILLVYNLRVAIKVNPFNVCAERYVLGNRYIPFYCESNRIAIVDAGFVVQCHAPNNTIRMNIHLTVKRSTEPLA